MCVVYIISCLCLRVCVTTVEFLQDQLRGVHVVPVAEVSCIFIGIYRRRRFAGAY